jgi:hypothetical protein
LCYCVHMLSNMELIDTYTNVLRIQQTECWCLIKMNSVVAFSWTHVLLLLTKTRISFAELLPGYEFFVLIRNKFISRAWFRWLHQCHL